MKTKAVFLILLLSLLIISCKKEFFPDNEDLKGNWTQIASPILLDREALYFDGVKTLYYAKANHSRWIQFDTLIYELNRKHEKLHLWPINSIDSESVHKILLNQETGELTIWGLYGDESQSKFIKQ